MLDAGQGLKHRYTDGQVQRLWFFVPKSGVNQKNTVINGSAFMDTVSVQMLRHYAEDAGKPQEVIEQITKPENVVHFIAEGVLIEK